MLALGMLRDRGGVHSFHVPMPVIKEADEVLVRIKEVGLDGTDFNMVRLGLQDIAEDRDRIIIGHEGVGVVQAVGTGVKSVIPGDVVVLTVRRGCGQCEPCLHLQSDMCLTGLYTERGLHKLDGLLTGFVVDREENVVRVSPELKRLAVFTEPLSIVEKGIDELRTIESRLPWFCPHPGHEWRAPQWGGCKVALVVGAGTLGLLAAAVIRLAGTYVYVADIVPEDSLKARLTAVAKAEYIDARSKTPAELVRFCCTPTGKLDIIFEASGAAETAVRLIPEMSRNGIYVMTGIPRGDVRIQLDAAELVRRIVRYNQVVIGTVNSNRRHFEMALGHLGHTPQFHEMLRDMVTRRVPLAECGRLFEEPRGPDQIKTVVEVEPWEEDRLLPGPH